MAELKIHIYTAGDQSVGIQDMSATVSIKDDLRYESQEELLDLLKGLAELWDGTAITELQQAQQDLSEAEMELEYWESMCAEKEEKGDLASTKEQVECERYARNARKDVGSLKRKITKLQKSYRDQGIWFNE
jgi:hypothetical protein